MPSSSFHPSTHIKTSSLLHSNSTSIFQMKSCLILALFVVLLSRFGDAFTTTAPLQSLSAGKRASQGRTRHRSFVVTHRYESRLASSPSTPEASVATATATSSFNAKEYSALTSNVSPVLTSVEIANILPHRYSFALVDKVLHLIPGKSAVGIKCITNNEPQFTGHFPDRPVMPGVLQVEALAQLAGIVCLQMPDSKPGQIFLFTGADSIKWKKPVTPGDVLVLEVEIEKWNAKFGIAKAKGRAYVDGELVVEVGSMTFAMEK
jgi:3-hydroxyacyl-[acyl-carrier-protein] dehydratase